MIDVRGDYIVDNRSRPKADGKEAVDTLTRVSLEVNLSLGGWEPLMHYSTFNKEDDELDVKENLDGQFNDNKQVIAARLSCGQFDSSLKP